ncbi:MAG: response regulator [Bradymonadaceae bacterium]|nr:response regulator [Lujinxingiaceae bacterium]
MQNLTTYTEEGDERFRLVMQNSFEVVVIINAKGIIKYLSPAITAMLGFELEELVEQNFFEFLPDELIHGVRNDLTRIMHKLGATRIIKLRIADKDGEQRHLEMKAQNLLGQPGVDGILLNIRDVSELAQREQDLAKAHARADEMKRLKASLLANMSHEIRTPLTSILGYAALIGELVPGEARAMAEAIEQSSKRLAETVSSVLALAQLEGEGIEICTVEANINEEVDGVVASLAELAAAKKLALTMRAPDESIRARVDRSFLRRILDNLIGNALKFTEKGGVIVELGAYEKFIAINVHDTGIGIDPSFLPQVFDDFEQESTGLSRLHEGTGLGLAITRRLVEALNGEIEVTSTKGQGTSFWVRLPRTPLTAELSALSCADELLRCVSDGDAPAFDRAHGLSMLLIEDNEPIRSLLVRELRKIGCVEAFSDAESALLRAQNEDFDVVLMDISLPGMNGLEALERLRSTRGYERRPIVAVTAHAMPGDEERFLKAGFSHYLCKPFVPSDLLNLVTGLTAA